MKPYQIYSSLDFKNEIPNELSHVSSYKGLLSLILDWLMIVATLYVMCHYLNIVTFFVGMFFLGSRQHALAILGHDAAHGLLLKNKKWNDLAADLLIGKPMFFDLNTYRKHHYSHHKFTNTDKDPDIVMLKSLGKFFKAKTAKDNFKEILKDFFWINTGYQIRRVLTLSGKSKDSRIKDRNKFTSLTYLLLSQLLLIIVLIQIHYLAPVFWYLALLGPLSMFLRIRNLGEHWFLINNRTDLTISRNYCVNNRIEAFFFAPHNVNYHLVHHLFISVPFYNIPKLHKILMGDVTYANEHENKNSIFFGDSVFSSRK